MECTSTESREPQGVEEAGCEIFSGAPHQLDYGTDKRTSGQPVIIIIIIIIIIISVFLERISM